MSSSRRLYGQVPYGVQRYTGSPTSVQHRRHLVPIISDFDMQAGNHSSRHDAKYLEHRVCVTAVLRLQSGMGWVVSHWREETLC